MISAHIVERGAHQTPNFKSLSHDSYISAASNPWSHRKKNLCKVSLWYMIFSYMLSNIPWKTKHTWRSKNWTKLLRHSSCGGFSSYPLVQTFQIPNQGGFLKMPWPNSGQTSTFMSFQINQDPWWKYNQMPPRLIHSKTKDMQLIKLPFSSFQLCVRCWFFSFLQMSPRQGGLENSSTAHHFTDSMPRPCTNHLTGFAYRN